MAGNEVEQSLVLTIFKGENFVCKTANGFQCQVEAKCCMKTVSSGVIHVSSTNSEPAFNSQLAWQLTRRELKELRGNKEPVKIKCFIFTEESTKPTEIGYCVLHVKDAIPLTMTSIDPSKAKSYPLLGTKEQWKNYHPKLHMQLHVEEIARKDTRSRVVDKSTPKQKKTTKVDTATSNPALSFNECPNSPHSALGYYTGNAANSQIDAYTWRINENDGCFELGNSSEEDDLYVLNITIISATHLHLLWNGRSPKKASEEEYIWQIKYNAYGCEIKSDAFVLSREDSRSRRTFIGDKATARIRANSANFYEYLLNTAVQFQVSRFQIGPANDLINEEVMGVSFADLKPLTELNTDELKISLEIMSEWGYSKTWTHSDKPEVRVVFQLEANPGFFKTNKADDGYNFKPVDETDESRPILNNEPERDSDECLRDNDKLVHAERLANNDLHSPSSSHRHMAVERLTDTEAVDIPENNQFVNVNNNNVDTERETKTQRDYDSGDNRVESLTQRLQLLSTENTDTALVRSEEANPRKKEQKIKQSNKRDDTDSAASVLSPRTMEELQAWKAEQKELYNSQWRKKKKQYSDKPLSPRTVEEINAWKAEQKELYKTQLKKKERDYLQILSQESVERDRLREKVAKKKMDELMAKEKELKQKEGDLVRREDEVRIQEVEMTTSTQKAALDYTSIVENAKITIKRLQEEHKIEISVLRRRNEELAADLEKYKGKCNLLEKKMEEREEYISRLKSEKYNNPDLRFPETIKLLEQENKLLKRQIQESERSRDQYKKQSQTLCMKLARLQEERDKQLKDENECLRMQIIASKQHKEQKKDRKAATDLSAQIKIMQDQSGSKVGDNRNVLSEKSENVRINASSYPSSRKSNSHSNEDEITRLTTVRNGLLNTGAYTQYDMVIKEMERRIVKLAETQQDTGSKHS